MARKKRETCDNPTLDGGALQIEKNVVEENYVVSSQPQVGGKKMAKKNTFLTEQMYDMTIGEILVTDLETGLEMFSGSLKSTNVNKTATKTPVRAGRDNTQWLEIVGDSEITIEVTDIQAKRDWLALKLGGVLGKSTIEVEAFPKNYKVGGSDSAKEITLDQTPVGGAPIVYNKATGEEITASLSDNPIVYNKATGEEITASLSDKKLTLTGECAVGDTVLVGSYKYSTEAYKVDIPASSQGRDVAITITRPQANSAQKVVCEKVWKFYRASFSTDFADEATSEKSESAISTSFTVLKHDDHDTLGVVCEKVWKFYRASFSTDFADEATSEKSESAISTSFTVLKHDDHDTLGFLAYVPLNQK